MEEPTIARWPKLFRLGFPLLLAFVCYGATLSLPWSLIDDGLFLERAALINASAAEGDLGGVLREVWKPSDNRFGPALIAHLAIVRSFFGDHAWLWHLQKVICFAIVIGLMLELMNLYTLLASAIIAFPSPARKLKWDVPLHWLVEKPALASSAMVWR